MLRDQALLEFTDNNFSKNDFLAFFYTWDERALSLGKIQRNSKEVIVETHSKNIPVIKRPSGGKAVIHGEDICFTVIAKQNHPEFGGALIESYSKIMHFLIKFLNEFFKSKYQWNTNIELKQKAKSCSEINIVTNQTNCFSNSINCEGIIRSSEKEIKILGAAQSMYANSFLQQGSLIVNNKSNILEENKLSFEEGLESLVDIYNKGQNIDLEKLCQKLNQELQVKI
ncbi:MAG: lipoate--protein ligase family protein [Candidatus Caenarcaniphilales bacterium]|nr:lipoate--protein ligase family protein [Candidatus Caenarcaniphilales bacterium]